MICSKAWSPTQRKLLFVNVSGMGMSLMVFAVSLRLGGIPGTASLSSGSTCRSDCFLVLIVVKASECRFAQVHRRKGQKYLIALQAVFVATDAGVTTAHARRVYSGKSFLLSRGSQTCSPRLAGMQPAGNQQRDPVLMSRALETACAIVISPRRFIFARKV